MTARQMPSRPASKPAAISPETVSITRLGHRGDGIAEMPDGPLYVPLTLPGERVRIHREDGNPQRARLDQVLEASPARTAPICRHFGSCGGCALQHMRPKAYLAWKRDQLRIALAQRGLEAPVAPAIAVPPQSRRRAVFAARQAGEKILFGYHARNSHRLVEITECPILVPAIARALPGLRALARPILPRKGELRIAVTATAQGLDVAFEGPAKRAPALVPLAAPLLERHGIARLSIAGETILHLADPMIEIDGVPVTLPPLAFLQASAASEAAMARLVLDGVGKAKRIADLYAGIGTFALRLARRARITAVEGSPPAIAALGDAGRRGRGLKPIETLKRDLARMPLSAAELKRFDAVVFDPPRSGAAAQAAELARSDVKTVVAVSCNPATLARDLKLLVDGSYAVTQVTPVDQFAFSPHIEAVATLSRA